MVDGQYTEPWLIGLIEHSSPCLRLQDCHERRALEVIQEAEQGQIYIEQATVRLLEGTAKKELDSSKGYACVFLGRNRYHVLREIPTIGFVCTGLKRVATDSLDSGSGGRAQPESYVSTIMK